MYVLKLFGVIHNYYTKILSIALGRYIVYRLFKTDSVGTIRVIRNYVVIGPLGGIIIIIIIIMNTNREI